MWNIWLSSVSKSCLHRAFVQSCISVQSQDWKSDFKKYMKSVGGWPILDGASWKEVPWWEIVSKTVSNLIISVVTTTLEEKGEMHKRYKHWFCCLDTPGIPDDYHIILGPNLNPRYIPWGIALFDLFPEAAEKLKYLALSLGADSNMIDKDISDVKQFLVDLNHITMSNPVTNPAITSNFGLRNEIPMMFRSSKLMQGVFEFYSY